MRRKIKKAFVGLWVVAGLFALGFVGLLVASFTTTTTSFSGEADLYLDVKAPDGASSDVRFFDLTGRSLPVTPDGRLTLHPKFETRETNIFDTYLGGPRPRTSVIAFKDADGRRHEMAFTYDRHDQVWKAEVSFPDTLIGNVEIEKSSLDFKGLDGSRRRYASAIYAKVLIGPPVISND